MAYLFCLPLKTKLQFHLNKLESTATGLDVISENKIKNDGTRKIDVSSIVGLVGAFIFDSCATGGQTSRLLLWRLLSLEARALQLSFPLKNYISSFDYYFYAFVYPNFEEDDEKDPK